jgi:mannan endo-1,4-beta-mannosidase
MSTGPGGAKVLAETQRLGRHRQPAPERSPIRRRTRTLTALIAAVSVVALAIAAFAAYGTGNGAQARHSSPQHDRYTLPTNPSSYIGLYAPDSNTQVKAFTTGTGVTPSVLVYYSGWPEPFRTGFAENAAKDGAVPLVQLNPTGISIAAIASGRYDTYLHAFAEAVRAYRHPVILSFGHEMNGYWYSWGNSHTPSAVFVEAWRHIVTLFRALGTQNVTWLWTINTIHKQSGVPSPGPWWPGSSYVNWIGIDGYYTSSSSVFASIFGPTIVAVRALTHDPILIAETSATPASGQPAKIANLFAGVHLYGLLGFVWFDTADKVDWRLSGPAALAAFRRGAETYFRLAS